MRISDWSSDVCSSDLKTPRIDDYKARYERPKPCQPVLAIDAVKTRTTLPGALHPLCRAQTQCRPRRDLVFRRSEEHTSELQSLMRISYAVFCLKKKNKIVYHMTIFVDYIIILNI